MICKRILNKINKIKYFCFRKSVDNKSREYDDYVASKYE